LNFQKILGKNSYLERDVEWNRRKDCPQEEGKTWTELEMEVECRQGMDWRLESAVLVG
jgi:hypothetical protein